MKQIPLGVINISATPHTQDGSTYVDLLKAAFALKMPIKIRGDEYAMLASCVDYTEGHPLAGLTGEIHKFTEIHGEWENVKALKAATPDDLTDLNIPENLKPNRESFRYFLFPKEHRMVVQLRGERRGITHSAVQRLLQELFSREIIKARFPLVAVTIEQEPESLSQILAMPQLNSLYIIVNRPNAGEGADAQEIRFVENLLIEQGAESLEVDLKHAPGSSLKPNNENLTIARVATSYGQVVGLGRDDENRPLKIDTSEHPIRDRFEYDKKATVGFVDQMFAKARSLVARVIRRDPPPADGISTISAIIPKDE